MSVSTVHWYSTEIVDIFKLYNRFPSNISSAISIFFSSHRLPGIRVSPCRIGKILPEKKVDGVKGDRHCYWRFQRKIFATNALYLLGKWNFIVTSSPDLASGIKAQNDSTIKRFRELDSVQLLRQREAKVCSLNR